MAIKLYGCSEKSNINDDVRSKIRVRDIIVALENHIIDGVEMSATQVNAALALLKKTLPDLQQNSGENANHESPYLSHEEALKLLS